jgi:hypothetical protein
MRGVNYDSWLTEPYEQDYYESEKERIEEEERIKEHLENLSVLKTEEEIEDYLVYYDLEEDPRETHRHLLGSGG